MLSVYGMAIIFGFQYVFNRTFFFTGPTRGNRWLRFRWWYALYDYNSTPSPTEPRTLRRAPRPAVTACSLPLSWSSLRSVLEQ